MRSRLLSVGCGVLLLPCMAMANVGPPARGGHVVAEPVGVIGVQIVRETLALDLRPLATNGLVRVEAVYQLHNPGPEVTLDLLFATGAKNVTDFEVWLGNDPIAVVPMPNAELPASWQPPKQTPGLAGEGGLAYLNFAKDTVLPMGFTLVVPPGRRDLKVKYAASAATHFSGDPTVYRQFAYVLAPARAWAGFGGLDLTVRLPTGWLAASAPTLERDEDVLFGNFAVLPADAIALTVQAPAGPAYQRMIYTGWALLGLATFGGVPLCIFVGQARGRRPDRMVWPIALGLGIVWSTAVFGAGLFAVFGPEWVLPEGQVSHYGYGQAFAVVGVSILTTLVFPIGFGIAQLSGVVARGRLRESFDAPGRTARSIRR